MNSRRTIIIAAALVLAALAFFGNVYYLNGAQQRAYKNAKLVDVYVVKKTIPKGLDGASAVSEGYIQPGQIPQAYRPGTALSKSNISSINSNVAINSLSPGQIVVDGQFVSPAVAQVTFAQQIKPGEVAVTVSVDQVHGVAGLLMPGDKVDILVTGKPANGDDSQEFMNVMYQNVSILAIGTKAAPQAGDTTATTAAGTATGDTGLITFEVPIDAAQRIALASGSSNGTSIYLALVPPDNQPVDGTSSVTANDLLHGVPGNGTPYPNGSIGQ